MPPTMVAARLIIMMCAPIPGLIPCDMTVSSAADTTKADSSANPT